MYVPQYKIDLIIRKKNIQAYICYRKDFISKIFIINYTQLIYTEILLHSELSV